MLAQKKNRLSGALLKANERAGPRWNEMDCIMTKHPIFNSIRSLTVLTLLCFLPLHMINHMWRLEPNTSINCRLEPNTRSSDQQGDTQQPDFNRVREILKLH